jgi:hypothetical protein
MPNSVRQDGDVIEQEFTSFTSRLIGNRFWPSGALARSLKPKTCISIVSPSFLKVAFPILPALLRNTSGQIRLISAFVRQCLWTGILLVARGLV